MIKHLIVEAESDKLFIQTFLRYFFQAEDGIRDW